MIDFNRNGGSSLKYRTVLQLPQASANTMNYIYVVPAENSSTGDQKDEYITVNNNGVYYWEKVGTKIPTKVSELQNDAGYVTQATVIVSQEMPSTWNKSSIASLIQSVQDDDTAIAGRSYVGTVSSSGLPTGISQAELKIEITRGSTTGNKILVLTIDSEDISPYHWTRVAAYGRTGTWRPCEVQNNKVTSLSSSSTDAQYPSAKCVYDIIGDVESLLAAI